MRLVIDIGNSRIKWALGAAGELSAPASFARPRADHDDAWERAWGHLRPEGVTVCSVAGRRSVAVLRDWVERRWAVPFHEVRAREHCGPIVNAYADPASLGADRWANLLGARAARGPLDCIIVDAGTAVTVDALRADGRHLGGAIFAGLSASRAGLRSAAPALPAAHDEAPLPSDNTAGAIGGGTLIGLAGAIERVAMVVGGRLTAPERILTGGDAERLAPWLDAGWSSDPLLTLRGLLHSGDAACAG
ncbi:MAG: type III pantothenate kinase [Halofilum sp. (in: g-proteobacteria)]|nr:type III pantothenate kinase [Halofilum sp. (in: g-proteobacteria)]